MSLFESIRLAWAGLRANKMRALLTMLGIIIGISSVIAILTVGSGLSDSVTSSMSSLGATNITIVLRERSDDVRMGVFGTPTGSSIEESDRITDEMITALCERYPDAVAGVSLSESVGSGQGKIGRSYANVSVTGVSTDYLNVSSVKLLKGRDLLARDQDGSRSVCIVSDKLVGNLYGGDAAAALGQELVVYMDSGEILSFSIIGVYQYEAGVMDMYSTTSEKDRSTTLYIPVTTAKKLAGSDDGYTSLTVLASNEVDSATFASQAANFLNRYYDTNNDYEVAAISMESMLDSMNTMMSTVNIALSIIAGISLLVGGIGVMNIMLVSVTERTREIGTRKALGATNGDIRAQFVVESMIVCLIGGVIGIILGTTLGYVGSSLLDMPSWPSVGVVALAVGFSLAIGVFFGYYPANKAAKLDPIEALRYE